MVSPEEPGDSTADCAWSGLGDEAPGEGTQGELRLEVPAAAPLPGGLLRRLLGRVSTDDFTEFTPDEVDHLIRASLSSGVQSLPGIRAFVKSCFSDFQLEGGARVPSRAEIRLRLADPVRAVWYRRGAEERLPGYCLNVYLALLRRVLRDGNVAAARMFLRRFDPAFRESEREETVKIEAKAEIDPVRESKLIARLREMTEADADGEEGTA